MLHPELGFQEEDIDFTRRDFYAGAMGPFGEVSLLPPVAYRSRIFQELENEKIWTREWVCIGAAAEIPNPGDLLPFTVGQHGVHVQRLADGALVGRFNKAQHGGCRAVPAQCRTGKKTKCSYTACGFSRDRPAIRADASGEPTPEMGQFLGSDPDRLIKVAVAEIGPFIFVNLDAQIGAQGTADGTDATLSGVPRAPFTLVSTRWREQALNWKLSGRAFVSLGAIADRTSTMMLARSIAPGDEPRIAWCFPNLLLARDTDTLFAAVLQPTSYLNTMWRTMLLAVPGREQHVHEGLHDRWLEVVDDACKEALAIQSGSEASPANPSEAECTRTGYDFNQYLISRILTDHPAYWNAPLIEACPRR